MHNTENHFLDVRNLAKVSSAFYSAVALASEQYERLRTRFGRRFVVRSGYPPHFSVPVEHEKNWSLRVSEILRPRILIGAAAVVIYAASFWITLLFL